jgi:methyl halide transferase
MEQMLLDKNYWENRYNQGQTGWDIGTASDPVKEYTGQYPNKDAAILIPGCGNAHEAAHLIELGFTSITLIDIAASAVEAVREKLGAYEGKQLHIICGDFFEQQQKFDLIIEQTFFCALPPAQRSNYAVKMYDLLADGGQVAGVLFDRYFEGGPPFGGSREEYVSLFSEKFHIKVMEQCRNSIAARAGTELFFILIKK